MKKIAFVLAIGSMLLLSPAFAKQNRYEIKSGLIEYSITGSGKVMGAPISISGDIFLKFKDYGELEYSKELLNETMMGDTQKSVDITKYDRGIVYSVDEEEKTIYKQDISKIKEDNFYNLYGEEGLKSIGGKKVGSDKILGFRCTIWKLKDATICVYKGVPLKVETTVMGTTQTQIAKSAKFNVSLSNSEFALPNYPIKTMDDMMDEAQKQMENLSPEEKEMMKNMMQNMQQMYGK